MTVIIIQEGFDLAGKISVRDAMIDAATALISQRGVSASGMQDIVAEAAAPRGSIYHHFPGGKDELVVAALARVCNVAVTAIGRAAEKGQSAEGFVAGVALIFRIGAERADWTEGCPVAATSIEGDRQSPAVREAISVTFRAWQAAIARGLRQHGRDDAESEALMILGALEGGLLLARGLRSPEPYDAAVALLRRGLGDAAAAVLVTKAPGL